MRLDTASNIINDALLELGLIDSALADPYTSTDKNAVLMRALLKALGRELVREHAWTHLQKTHTFNTVNGTDNYALPTDFCSWVPSTEWNRTTDMPLTGAMGPEGWQTLQASSVATTASYYFRTYGNKLYLYPTPTAAESVAYEYQGAYWVQPSGQTVPTTETPTASTDTLWFDGYLLTRGLKWKFREEKRLDAGAEWNAYQKALGEAKGNDGAHSVIDLSAGARGERLPRLPETGWGS